jgi:NAD+ synthase
MDLALWALEHGVPASALGTALGIDAAAAAAIYDDIASKRRTTRYLHEAPVLLGTAAAEPRDAA